MSDIATAASSGDDADDGRDVVQAGHLGRPPATLARDDLVADRLAGLLGRQRPHDDRLHDALGADRIGQLLQALGPHVEPRLVAPALQQVDRQARQFFVARRGGPGGLGCGGCRRALPRARREPGSPA